MCRFPIDDGPLRSPVATYMLRTFFVALLLAASAAATAAQEVELYMLRATSDAAAFATPGGWGLAGRFSLLDWLDLQVSFSRRADVTHEETEVCTLWQPRWQCSREAVEVESKLSEASVIVLPHLLDTDYLTLSIGGGATLNELRSSGYGTSGRPLPINIPGGSQVGFAGTVDVGLRPSRWSRFVLHASARLHHVDLDGCLHGEETPKVERFCGFYTFRELRVGLGFRVN